MDFKWYGKVGTETVIAVEPAMGATMDGYVEMQTLNPPSDGRLYVVSPNGLWELSMDNEKIRETRKARYLEVWPVTRQLEAQQDLVNGDATLWNEMQADFKRIKEELPYVGKSGKLK